MKKALFMELKEMMKNIAIFLFVVTVIYLLF